MRSSATSTDPEAVGPNDAARFADASAKRRPAVPINSHSGRAASRRRGAARARAAELPSLLPQARAETWDPSRPQQSHAADLSEASSCASPPLRTNIPRGLEISGGAAFQRAFDVCYKKRKQNN